MRIIFIQFLMLIAFRLANCCVDEKYSTYTCNDCSSIRMCGGGRDTTVNCGEGWYCNELQLDGVQRAACAKNVPNRCQIPEVTTTQAPTTTTVKPAVTTTTLAPTTTTVKPAATTTTQAPTTTTTAKPAVTTTTQAPTTTTVKPATATTTQAPTTTTAKPAVTTTTQAPTTTTAKPAATTTTQAPTTTTANPAATVPLLCTGEGIYADPFNCAKFHYCHGYGNVSLIYDCPELQVFDPAFKIQPCKARGQDQADECPKVNCTAGGSMFKPYGTNGRFYAYCYADKITGSTVVAMFQCSIGTVFDGTRCVFDCVRKGLFTNTLNPSSYYECYYLEERLVYNVRMCPEGKKFKESLQACV